MLHGTLREAHQDFVRYHRDILKWMHEQNASVVTVSSDEWGSWELRLTGGGDRRRLIIGRIHGGAQDANDKRWK